MSALPSPSGELHLVDAQQPPWRLIGLVAGLTGVRLWLGGALHLSEDEAYYRLWSMFPAFGYLDHPPMVAWWIALGRDAMGDTPLGVRVLPVLGSALASGLVWDIARRIGADSATAERAGIWFNAMLLTAAGGLLAVPDAPAALFWLLTLSLTLRAVQTPARAIPWWLAAGAAAGLATLSKYSALFLGPGLLAWLMLAPSRRALLRTAGPWLALIVAAAMFGVNIGWNLANHNLTFIKQFGRVAPHGFAPRYLVELLITQTLLINPAITLFAVRAAVGKRPTPRVDTSLLVVTSAPFLAYLLLHSLHDRVQAHWPAPVYPAIAIVAAVTAGHVGGGVWARARALVLPIGLGAVGVLSVCLVMPPGLMFGLPNIAAPIQGWSRFADQLESLRRSGGYAWIGVSSYGLAAELADEPAIHAPVLQIRERDRWRNPPQGHDANLRQTGLVIDLPRRINAEALKRCFVSVRPLGRISRGGPTWPATVYAVFAVSTPTRDILSDGC